MTFLEEIEKHNTRLDHYQEAGNYSGDVNDLRDLARIYMEYVYKGKGDVKPNLGCGACKQKMMQRLISHRTLAISEIKIDEAIERDKYYEASSPDVLLEDLDTMIDSLTSEPYIWLGEDFDSMKMGELKSLASKKGLNTYKKTKVELIQWLKENS